MKRVAIDIGHANGSGARGNGYDEHAQCAKLAAELKKALSQFKLTRIEADIIDFPEAGNSGDLAATAKAVNAGNYDACVSLHMDAASKIVRYENITYPDGTTADYPIYENDPRPHGAHVCYYSTNGKVLAHRIAVRLCPQMPGRANQTVKRDDLYILKKTKPVAVLVECGFITNSGDSAWVDQNPDRVALSIALGIADYLDDYGQN